MGIYDIDETSQDMVGEDADKVFAKDLMPKVDS